MMRPADPTIPETNPLLPQRFANRFEHRSVLGQGAMGMVVRAYDEIRRQEVALKYLTQVSPEGLYLFKNEFRLLAEIHHTNVLRLFELLECDDRWALAMEIVEGAHSLLEFVRPHLHLTTAPDPDGTASSCNESTAADLNRTESPLSLTSATRVVPQRATASPRRLALRAAELLGERLDAVLIQLIDGLDAVHQRGMLHRDIKPSNVLVEDSGRVVICDFGLVTAASSTQWNTAGTPAYMSPEQADGGDLTPATDFYGVGVLLYEALTGELPVVGESWLALLTAKRQADIKPLQDIHPNVDKKLASLCLDLLHPVPARRPKAEEIRKRLGRTVVSVSEPAAMAFVGRDRERSVLRDAYAAVRAGKTQTVLVTGASGFGKSSLVADVSDELRQQHNALIFDGRCYQTESVPFKALDAVVEAVASHLADPHSEPISLPADLAPLVQVFPGLRRARPIENALKENSTIVPEHQIRTKAQRAFRQLMLALAVHRPVVVAIDDLQWGDLDSAPFLRELMVAPETPGLLLIATCRSDAASRESALLKALCDDQTLHRRREVRIEALTSDEAVELAMGILGDEPPPAGFKHALEHIVSDAGGSPLFVAELARARRNGEIAESTEGLDALLDRRIAALPRESARLLEATALTAWPQPISLLSQALGLANEASALVQLRATNMIQVTESRDGERICTYHDRIRETAAARLSFTRRKELHRLLAEAFEKQDRQDAEALVVHWEGAGQPKRAGHYAMQAAQRALGARAYRRAAHHYSRALSQCDFSKEERTSVLIARGDALFLAGGGDAVEACCEAAAGADAKESVRLHTLAILASLRSGDMKRADELADRAGRGLGVRIPDSRAALVVSLLWSRVVLTFRAPRIRRLVPVKHIPTETVASLDLSRCLAGAMAEANPLKGFAIHSNCLRTALRVGHPGILANRLATDAFFLSALKGAKAADKIAKLRVESMRAARKCDDPAMVALTHACLGLGNYARGVALGNASAAMLKNLSRIDQDPAYAWDGDRLRTYTMHACLMAGKLAQVALEIPPLLADARATQNDYLREQLGHTAIFSCLAQDQVKEARALLARTRPKIQQNFTVYRWLHRLDTVRLQAYEEKWEAAAGMASRTWEDGKRSTSNGMLLLRFWTFYAIGRTSAAASRSNPKHRDRHLGTAAAALSNLVALTERMPAFAMGAVAHLRALLSEDVSQAVPHLCIAVSCFQRCQSALYGMPLRMQLGRYLGGTEGETLCRVSAAWMRSEQVGEPEKFLRWLSPMKHFRP